MSATDTTADLAALIARLADAQRRRTAIAPLTDEVELSLDDAYRLQDAVLDELDPDNPRTLVKLGLTSRAKQQQMSVDAPIYGYFHADAGLDVGEPLQVDTLIQARAEPEIAFLTGRELSGAAVTTAHVLAATDAVLPALDVLDSRYAGYRFTLPDVVADDASAARYVVGAPRPIGDADLALTGCVFERNGELVATASGAAVLEHPASAVAWFVRALARRGRSLPAGSLVLAGALTAAIPVEPGDEVRVHLDRFGSVSLRCE